MKRHPVTFGAFVYHEVDGQWCWQHRDGGTTMDYYKMLEAQTRLALAKGKVTQENGWTVVDVS